ncbi:MAG: right-handed parallel beta-helix repeat-containing protein, partial [Thermoplasmata archaeon]|nr:right-handed parallel beta-helix repeat-containing protein [Thermoplasmata archaeon]
MRKTTFALASIIAIALIFPATSGNAIAETEDVSVYAEHAPILIEGDDDFTPENGVTGGSGTELDPYIVEWWEINSFSSDGIKISDTTACLVIRNVVIYGGDSSFDAISLAGCSNVSISCCTVSSAGTGINLVSSRDIIVSENQVSLCLSDGIIVEASSRVQIIQNDIRFNNWAPFHDWPCGVLIESPDNPNTRSENVTIGGNIIQDNVGGAIGIGWLDDETSDILVVANTLTGNEDGVWTFGTRKLVISGNQIEDNQWGVYLEHTQGAKVHSNNFVNNGLQGYDDWG